MSVGLLVSAVTSWRVGSSALGGRMAAELALPLIIGLVVVVIVSNALSPRVGARVALLLFIVYSVSMGLAMSCLFIAADLGSIATAFVSAAAMFGSAGVYDAVTGRSLASLRGLLSMGLGGIVIASSINLAIYARPVGELWISIAGVLALVGLTAWHVRAISRADDPRTTSNHAGSLAAALALYLEVVNVFLYLASRIDRFVGDTREDPAWHARHGLPTERRIRPR
jgi:FtsH-binding integral membrane protein